MNNLWYKLALLIMLITFVTAPFAGFAPLLLIILLAGLYWFFAPIIRTLLVGGESQVRGSQEIEKQ